MTTVYVDSSHGSNSNAGSASRPWKTLDRALRSARRGTRIVLRPGTYDSASGERFPLLVPDGVEIVGNAQERGSGVRIQGSGTYSSRSSVLQITLRLGNGSLLEGTTVTNAIANGTAVFVEAGTCTIARNTFANCAGNAIVATERAKPAIADNLFLQARVSGIRCAGNAKGEIRNNRFEASGIGVDLSENAAPAIADNHFNRCDRAIVLSDGSRPVLRDNRIENSVQDGLVLSDRAFPDLGHPQDPGNNIFRQNGRYDVYDRTGQTFPAAGNQIDLTRTVGKLQLLAVEVPTVVPPLADAPPIAPTPSPAPVPTPAKPDLFPDVPGNYWAADFIAAMAAAGLMRGFPDGLFRPDAPLTRAQYAAIVSAAFSVPATAEARAFPDVPPDFWAKAAIDKAARAGFISGFADGRFHPDRNLTRIQAWISLASGLGLSGGKPDLLGIFRDRAEIPSYATNAIAAATANRLVANHPDPTRLELRRDATRAEICVVIYQARVARGRSPAIGSSAIAYFSDIQNHWAQAFIIGLAKHKNFLRGFPDGSLRPDSSMTRAEYAALLASNFALDEMVKRGPANFEDVPESFWGRDAIQQAYRAGFLSGYSATSFRPQQPISKMEVLVSLAAGMTLPLKNANLALLLDDYRDIPTWARQAVATAVASKIVVNYPTRSRLEPNRPATRAEVVANLFLRRVALGLEKSVFSSYIL